MSNYILQLTEEQNKYYLTIQLNDQNTYSLTPEEIHYSVQVVNTEKILVSDLPDNIPISKLSGLSDFLDEYEFDCGNPLPPS